MREVEQCSPHSIKVTSKGFSKYLFYGEDTVWNHLSSCPHTAVLEIRGGPVRRGERFLQKDVKCQLLLLTGGQIEAQGGNAAPPSSHSRSHTGRSDPWCGLHCVPHSTKTYVEVLTLVSPNGTLLEIGSL